MADVSGFDKQEFLISGAIFSMENQVWLFWGEAQDFSQRPEAIAISPWKFFSSEEPWKLYPYVVQVQREEAMTVFKKSRLDLQWQAPSKTLFENQFEEIQDLFKTQGLKKIVPYCFESSKHKVNQNDIESFIANGLENQKGFLYGYWNSHEGLLGLSPEILIQQKSRGEFESMALAGTQSLSEFKQDPDSLLNDPKEMDEHNKVIQDIVERLKTLGRVYPGRTEVLTTPHLAHLHTPLYFETADHTKVETVVSCLHPTPALGCYPRENGEELLKEFDKTDPRTYFGAPFGVSFDESKSIYVVAIRNLIWNSNGLRVGSGCGVVPASDKEKEWLELKNKRNSVKGIFGL